jgi:putative ABC transport system permease protein
MYPQMNANITIFSSAVVDPEKIRSVAEFTAETDGGTVNFIGETRLHTTDDFMTEDYKKVIEGAGGFTETLTIISLSDEFYSEIGKDTGVKNGGAILINTASSAYGNHADYRPFNTIPEALTVQNENMQNENNSFDIPISGSVTDVPGEIQTEIDPRDVNIIVPYEFLTAENLIINNGVWFVAANNPDTFEQNANDANLYEKIGIDESSFYIQNIRKTADAINGLARLITVFAYSFVGLLTLIALTSVISTISTNIRMRAKEFAVLQSIGETRSGIKRMLCLESLMWSVKSLIFGLILGLSIFYLIYRFATGTVPYPFEFPTLAVIESIAAVFAVSLITMLSAVSKLGKGSIIEDIRTESF